VLFVCRFYLWSDELDKIGICSLLQKQMCNSFLPMLKRVPIVTGLVELAAVQTHGEEEALRQKSCHKHSILV